MDIKFAVSQLDQIANEIQPHNPVIAMAIDQISDELERTAGILDKAKEMLGGVWNQVKGQIKKMTLDKAIATILEILKKNPDAITQLQVMLEGGLKTKTALRLSPTIIALILSALTLIGAAKAFDTLKEQVDASQRKQITALEDIDKLLR